MPCTFNNSQEGQGGWNGENKEKSSKNGSPKGKIGRQIMQGLVGYYKECDFLLRWNGKSP